MRSTQNSSRRLNSSQLTGSLATKDIHDKHVNPPATTDYAIIFLATEGLYAEALRQPQFVEEMLLKYRTMIAGPTTLSAIVSSLRMGFQTLVVEKRASEVWRVLGAVKTEFGKFGGVLDKVHRQLSTATRTIEQTGVRRRAMERQLRAVEQMDPIESAAVLALPAAGLKDLEGEYAEEEAEDEETGVA
jgi:DNA recombination protein RmuC